MYLDTYTYISITKLWFISRVLGVVRSPVALQLNSGRVGGVGPGPCLSLVQDRAQLHGYALAGALVYIYIY